VVVFLLLAAGCGSRPARMSGAVTYQGKRVTYGSVIVLAGDKITRSGAIQPDGTYLVEGVPPGEVTIAVISPDPRKSRTQQRQARAAKSSGKEPPAPPTDWFPIPGGYSSPHNTMLRCTVTSGRFAHDIELK
jgi:hypothetical protein